MGPKKKVQKMMIKTLQSFTGYIYPGNVRNMTLRLLSNGIRCASSKNIYVLDEIDS